MDDLKRADLPRDADNYDVWCERCQRVHRYYTFTQEDYDRVVADGAKRLQEAIDDHIIAEIYKHTPVTIVQSPKKTP